MPGEIPIRVSNGTKNIGSKLKEKVMNGLSREKQSKLKRIESKK